MRKPTKYSKRRGTTLIEVLAGLVILSTILVAIAMARGRFLQQWKDADRRIECAQAADHLLTGWFARTGVDIPISSEGQVDGMPNFIWRTHPRNDRAADGLGAVVVHLEVFDLRSGATAAVNVDFLVHQQAKAKTKGGAPKS